jgi:quinol monooxygenase YgiN
MSGVRFLLAVLSLAFLASTGPVFAQNPPPAAAAAVPIVPLYVITHVDFIPRNAPAGEKALHQYALESRKEAGSVRFEIVQEAAQPNHYIMLEVWRDRAAYDAHLGSETTLRFRDTLQPLIGSPFDVRLARFQPN